MDFLNNINLNKNELQNVVIQNLATAPASPKKGQIYFNTTDNKYYVYNGSSWIDLTSQGKTYTFTGGLTETSGTVSIDNTVTGATKAKITYDNHGLVTAGADLEASDIPNLTLSKITDITATATELNYVDGVTSAIQDQIDSKVTKNTAITGATKCKITYDAKGLVTAGADLAASDIPDLSSSYVATNAAITAGTKAKITYDTKGLVTGGADLAASDIPDLSGTYVAKNDAITSATKCKITYDTKGLVTSGADLAASDIPDLSSSYVATGLVGAANGIAQLDANGLVPSTQLPSYVDDVIEGYYYNTKFYEDSAHTTEITPATGKIYVDLSTDKTYRWGGSAYVEISQSTIHKYTGTITGDGTTTSFTISHGLGTRDVVVMIYEGASPYAQVFTDVEMTSTSAIAVSFATAPANATVYKVVVLA